MFQELTSVYGEQCTSRSVPQQNSFESDEGFQPQTGISQGYQSYPFSNSSESSIPPHVYTVTSSGSFGSQGDLRQVDPRSHMVAMPTGYPDNQQPQHDLPAILNHPDLQWITTSQTDMRTQSPIDTSSPRPNVPSVYPTQGSPLTRTMPPQGATNNPQQSSATITHHHLSQNSYPSSSVQDPPPLQRVKKSGASSTIPPKPKGTPGRKRKFQDHELTPAEATKRHIRRERNKVAAAKCRNRRRELTDRLQGETDHLEDHQNMLHQEIMSLQQEKEHLEFILAAHSPNCKAGIPTVDTSLLSHDDTKMMSGSLGREMNELSLVPPPEAIDEITTNSDPSYYYASQQHQGPVISAMHNIQSNNNAQFDVTSDHSIMTGNTPTDLSNRGTAYTNTNVTAKNQLTAMSIDDLNATSEAPLDTPVCTLATPSLGNTVFTFPNTPTVPNPPTDINFPFQTSSSADYYVSRNLNSQTSSTMSFSAMPANRLGVSCSAAHRRSSSSESHHSPDSVKSPKLLAL